MKEDLHQLSRRAILIECEITVLKDLLRRAQWFLGREEQSSTATQEEIKEFAAEVAEVRKEHDANRTKPTKRK